MLLQDLQSSMNPPTPTASFVAACTQSAAMQRKPGGLSTHHRKPRQESNVSNDRIWHGNKLSSKLQGYPFLYESSLIQMLIRSSALGNFPKRSAATGVREGVVPGAASSTPRLHRLISLARKKLKRSWKSWRTA